MRTRSWKKLIRLNADEYTHLKKQSKISGLSGEALIRALIMDVDIKPIPPDHLSEILRQLSAIGNNINQIARMANSAGRINKADIDAITSMQTHIWHQVKSF